MRPKKKENIKRKIEKRKEKKKRKKKRKKNKRQHRRSLGQGEGCVCANAGKAGRGRVALSRLPALHYFAAAEPIESSHFEDPRPDADLKMALISVISTIRRFY